MGEKKETGRLQLPEEMMDLVSGGYTLEQLNEEERAYLKWLEDSFVNALASFKESELKAVKKKIAEFDEKMHKKYDL